MNRIANTIAAQVSVVRAFFHSGGLKAGTPSLDRLDAGQGHGALAERSQDQEDAQGLGPCLDDLPRGRRHELRDIAQGVSGPRRSR